MSLFDLDEILKRESEKVEWKKSVADVEDIIKTAVAFANDYSNFGGGYIVCGIEESTDAHGFQSVIKTGLRQHRLKAIEKKFCADLEKKVFPPLVPKTEEIIVTSENRILVFFIPASKKAHSFRATGKDSSTYYIRIGRDTKEARNGLLLNLLSLKGEVEPWDDRANYRANLTAIDTIMLREYLQQMGIWDEEKSIDEYLSASKNISTFIPAFFASDSASAELKAKNFSVLMFCSDPHEYIDGASIILDMYNGKDRSEDYAERHRITGSIVQQAQKCIDILNSQAYTAFDKTDKNANQVKYPERALHEALVNALVHRDYSIRAETRITVFLDRIEIYSPGALPRTIDEAQFKNGGAPPHWRNKSLAYMFERLKLAQNAGQGISTILRTMKAEGCPSPQFNIGTESITCILPAHPRHVRMRELYDIENHVILGKHASSFAQLEEILQEDPNDYRALDLFCKVCISLERPRALLHILEDERVQIQELRAGSVANILDVFSLLPDNTGANQFISKMLDHAGTLHFEENEFKRVQASLRKLDLHDEWSVFARSRN